MIRAGYLDLFSNSGSAAGDIGGSESIRIVTGYTKSENMPIVPRRRQMMKFSSSPVNQVDAQGTAYLCFPEDHSWFQGNISTDDESNYSLYGERISGANCANDEIQRGVKNDINGNINDKSEDTSNDDSESTSCTETDYYRVTMIDHFSGQKYVLPKILCRKEGSFTVGGNLFTSQHGEVTFQVENVYKGQKADIMIHRYLGAPSLLGKKCLLYSGQINILFNEIAETGRSWSL